MKLWAFLIANEKSRHTLVYQLEQNNKSHLSICKLNTIQKKYDDRRGKNHTGGCGSGNGSARPAAEKNLIIVDASALPEVMLRVLEAKRLIEQKKLKTVQAAIESVGISRSAFYKYKDAVYPFYENTRGRTLTMAMNMDNAPGLLSRVLNIIAGHGANILTINQTIPINNVANVTITVETRECDVSALAEAISADKGVSGMKILARE